MSQSSFTDDFSDNLSAWADMYGSDWSIQNSELHGFYSLGNGSIYDHQADLILKDDYQITGNWKASIDFIRVADDQAPWYFAAQAIFSIWQDFGHKILISVGDGGDYWEGLQDSIKINVQEWNGTWGPSNQSVSIDKVKFNWNPDEWHTASLEKRGNIYSLFVDDACIAHYIDSFLNGEGKIGMHTYGTRRLDNFKLEPISCTSSFADNFSDNLSAWTDIYGSDWTIQNNELHGYYSLGNGSIYDHQADLILNDDYQITGNWKASIDFIRVADDQAPWYFAAQAIFTIWQDFDHKISISVGDGGDYWEGLKDSIKINVQEWNGTWGPSNQLVSIDKVKFNWNPDEWHTASLEKRGNIYSLFVDDACIAHYIDTFLNGEGKVGLHTYGTRRLDNFSLEICSNLPIGIKEDKKPIFNDITIYPNPSSSNSVNFILSEGLTKENHKISIYNVYGLLVSEIKDNRDLVIRLNIRSFVSGIYVMKYQSEKYTISKIFIVK